MSFAVWNSPPPVSAEDLGPGEAIYQVGAVWVVTNQGPPTQAQIDAALAPGPNVPGFVAALKNAMGGIVASNSLAKAYPLFYPALETGQFADAQALIIDAHTTGVLSDKQYAAFGQFAATYHLPITLP